MEDEQEVKGTRFEICKALSLKHVEEVFGYRVVCLRMADVERATQRLVAQHIVGIRDDGGEFRNKFHTLAHEVVTRCIVGGCVEGVEFQYASRKDVHDVVTLEFDDVENGLLLQRHIVDEQCTKILQLFRVGQLT